MYLIGEMHSIHGRGRMTRPSHPHNTGTENIGFPPTRQTLLAPSTERRRGRHISAYCTSFPLWARANPPRQDYHVRNRL